MGLKRELAVWTIVRWLRSFLVLLFSFSVLGGLFVFWNYYSVPNLIYLRLAVRSSVSLFLIGTGYISVIAVIRLFVGARLRNKRWVSIVFGWKDLEIRADLAERQESAFILDKLQSFLVTNPSRSWVIKVSRIRLVSFGAALVLLLGSLMFTDAGITTFAELGGKSYTGRPWDPVLRDTLRVRYGSVYGDRDWVDEKFVAFNDTVLVREKNGRIGSSLFLSVEFLPSMVQMDWHITPPPYTGRASYTTSDSIIGIEGSEVKLIATGQLLDRARLLVSRETLVMNTPFMLMNSIVVGVDLVDSIIAVPIRVNKDLPPKVVVVSNSPDSILLRLTDDIALRSLSMDSVNFSIEGTEQLVSLRWGMRSTIEVVVKDDVQETKSLLYRTLNTAVLSARIDSLTAVSESREWIDSRSEEESRSTTLKEKQVEDREEDRLTEQVEQNTPVEFERVTEEFIEYLEVLYEMERLQLALELVDTSANAALDSLVQEQVEALEEGVEDIDGLQDVLEDIEGLDKSGDKRQKQAKEAAAALKDLLQSELANAMSINVERIKRLLFRSISASKQAEEIGNLELMTSRFRQLNAISTVSSSILDTVSILMVHDDKLGVLLRETSKNLHEVLKGIEVSGLETAYDLYRLDLVYRLNDLNALLYEILQSEKSALAAQKKACKNGKPGSTGKPSVGAGNRPAPSGKKPGGRRQGSVGERGQSDSQSGTQGQEKKDALKEGLMKLDEIEGTGGLSAEQQEELERLKRALLMSEGELGDEYFQEWQNKLWRLEEAVFSSDKEQGNSRKSDTSSQPSKKEDADLSPWFIQRDEQLELPLPVLKNKDK